MGISIDIVDVLDKDRLNEGAMARHALDLEHLRDLQDLTSDRG